MSTKFISWSIFVLLCFIWGSSFILMKVSSRGLTAYQIAALRIFSAALVFIPFAIFHIAQVPRQKTVLLFLPASSETCYLHFVLQSPFKDRQFIGGILNSLTPICVVLIGILVFRDHIKLQKITGVAVGFAGYAC
jgi:drug/metabolite transporter (DMT)-like permease